jgi:hypothetical protein
VRLKTHLHGLGLTKTINGESVFTVFSLLHIACTNEEFFSSCLTYSTALVVQVTLHGPAHVTAKLKRHEINTIVEAVEH